MNAGINAQYARGLSASPSNEARQLLADWLKRTKPAKARPDVRAMLLQRYPAGLLNDAEFEALFRVLTD
ncbi:MULTISPECIES: hypothetical protein [Pseudomonas syringae group]|uniref:Uncharacterized protein n=4 Tax=Pseudomonas syringae group TaxID=136849 RepID=A0AA40TVH5_9PSED|nr:MULTISPECIES: hypothetical protein [Pseudomonas syringae group]KGS14222.1 hypothetical protein OA77_12305 [Pseudomonas coronafaciens]KOP58651.1 hypothetical protein OX88_01235 [Pseudomonas coronafaciens pv. porri]KOP60155.1 hypothetical protein OX90_07395 [Pseudomonas coronafaciens pv. porri]KPB52395.1 Uncharacterized protein AC511_0703 [Pseudomonas coronafaciens pv. oryzae]KPW39057.1 Uncharacterized protein ALO66_02050 [Pseudomonas coronafaciens pv. atropurpurea]